MICFQITYSDHSIKYCAAKDFSEATQKAHKVYGPTTTIRVFKIERIGDFI